MQRPAQARYGVHLEVGCGRAPPSSGRQRRQWTRSSTRAQMAQRWVRFACACAGGRMPPAAVYGQLSLEALQLDCLSQHNS
eukprot:1922993-Amphidinium_carterae.1